MGFDDIDRVTRFAVKKYKIKYPKNMTLEDFIHEVRVFIFKYCHIGDLKATGIIKNVRWTSAALFKQDIETRPKLAYSPRVPPKLDQLDDRDEVEEILDLPMADEYKEILKNLASGLDPSEVYDKMGLSKQTYSLKKKIIFNKVRNYMSDAPEIPARNT